MWSKIAKYAVKLAIWAVGHPEVAKQVVDDARKVVSDVKSAKDDISK